jgi:hypothetical protein
MSDEIDRLSEKASLLQLLSHYAELGAPNRETWQDRLMSLEGVEPPEMTKLHGELLAFAWIEQNTGNCPGIRTGTIPGCYRVTLAGLRAIKQVQSPEADAEPEIVEEKPFPKRLKKKREKAEEVELAASAS